MPFESIYWLILLIPLAGFLINGIVISLLFRQFEKVSGFITVGTVFLSFVLSVVSLINFNDNGVQLVDSFDWLMIGDVGIKTGFLIDPLTSIMLIVVTGVSLMIQIYSIGYMASDEGYSRYFSFMALFTFSMLGLVLSKNLIHLFVFWELVGISSYLLIGFWFKKSSAAIAAKKAFLMTRVGDFGLMVGILFIFSKGQQYLDIPTLYKGVSSGEFQGSGLLILCIILFLGAVGKSAQFPLHSWLPDAMEGPTPVSALLHSATMVTAGVFLIGRLFPLFESSSEIMMIIAIIGGFTAVFAATMGIVSDDIKRVLAYSTISQLGYMVLALGSGFYAAAFFHLFTHAWFKSLLFLSAGSVSHATGTFNMKFMGGLRKRMPVTYVLTLLGALSLIGIFPFSGFWSKDEILGNIYLQNNSLSIVLFILASIGVFLTALYMTRVILLTFHGSYKGGIAAENSSLNKEKDDHSSESPHESPRIMLFPMIILGFLSVVIGFLVNPLLDLGIVGKHAFSHLLEHNSFFDNPKEFHFVFEVAILSTILALLGISTGILVFIGKLNIKIKSVYRLLINKYYFDELYENIFVTKIFYKGIGSIFSWIDENIIDESNAKISEFTLYLSNQLTKIQNGHLQSYGFLFFVALTLLMIVFFVTNLNTGDAWTNLIQRLNSEIF
jgi:NADH-quinone oxidoreductase subunit L